MSDYLRERVNPAMPSYLDVWEAAEYLSLPLSTVRRFIKEGLIPIMKPGGRPKSHIRIWSGHLDEASATGRGAPLTA